MAHLFSPTESRAFDSFLDAFGSSEGDVGAGSYGKPATNGNGAPPPAFYGKAHVYSATPKLSHVPSPTQSAFSYSTASYQTYSPTCAPLPQFYPSKPSPLPAQDLPLYPHMPALPSPDLPLLPYQTSKTAAEIEDEKQQRMRQQTLELAGWMRARGVVGSPNASIDSYTQSNGRSARSYAQQVEAEISRGWTSHGASGNEGTDDSGRESARERLRDEREYELLEARPTKRRAISNNGEEREDSSGVQETMGSLRDAELRAGLSQRVDAHSLPPTPPIPPASRPIQQPPPAATKQRKSTTGATPSTSRVVKAKAEPLPPIESDSSLNPPPASTPSNIPPAPPRPISQRPAARPRPTAPVASASTTSHSHAGSKPALLSTAQKKANHIASEQKRRAAIKFQYEQLCSAVPSLRAAVEEFEERVRKAGKGKRNGDKGALMGGIEIGGEKVDGRAGPRSEAVVLGKSVEYVRELLRSREEYLTRLSDAYARIAAKGGRIEGGQRMWEDAWDEETMAVGDGGSHAGEGGEQEEWEEED